MSYNDSNIPRYGQPHIKIIASFLRLRSLTALLNTHFRYLSASLCSLCAEDLASKNRLLISSISGLLMLFLPPVFAKTLDGVNSCTANLNEESWPTCAASASASSSTSIPSVFARIDRIWKVSSSVYGIVRMIIVRSNKSTGMPCAEEISVPRMGHIPRLVANTTMGARVDSSARLRYVKHSISNMCTWKKREHSERSAESEEGGGIDENAAQKC